MNSVNKIIAVISQSQALAYMIVASCPKELISDNIKALVYNLKKSASLAAKQWPKSLTDKDEQEIYEFCHNMGIEQIETPVTYCSYLIEQMEEILSNVKNERRFTALKNVQYAVSEIKAYYECNAYDSYTLGS